MWSRYPLLGVFVAVEMLASIRVKSLQTFAWKRAHMTSQRALSVSALPFLHYRGGSHDDSRRDVTRQLASSSLQATVSSSDGSSLKDEKIDPSLLSVLEIQTPTSNFGGIKHWNTASLDKFRVLFVLGGPGAGKGTQSALIDEHYPTVHLSVGELLREEQTKTDSPHRKLIEETLVSGQIVPVEISLQLLQNAMQEKANEMGNQIIFLVDGFPRNFDNLSGWCRIMGTVAALWGVLVYQCPLKVLENRILERSKNSGRSDDNLESVQKRFRTFETQTVPVIDTLRNCKGQWSVIDIRGDQPLEDVWLASQEVFNRLIMHDVLTANGALLNAVENGNVELYQQVCAPEWFENEDPVQVMKKQEGETANVGEITDAQLDVISGKHVAVSYLREMQGEVVMEKRIWSHQGVNGWRNVHFSRVPEGK